MWFEHSQAMAESQHLFARWKRQLGRRAGDRPTGTAVDEHVLESNGYIAETSLPRSERPVDVEGHGEFDLTPWADPSFEDEPCFNKIIEGFRNSDERFVLWKRFVCHQGAWQIEVAVRPRATRAETAYMVD